jgi:hypothetical protein
MDGTLIQAAQPATLVMEYIDVPNLVKKPAGGMKF